MNETEYRYVTVSDAGDIAEIYRYYVENTAISFEYTAPDAAEIARRIEKTAETYPYIAAVKNGRIIGYAYAGRYGERKAFDRSAELSIYIDRAEHGAGIGKRLYGLIEAELKAQGVINAYACITSPSDGRNDPYVTDGSIRFHEKLGYGEVGRQHRCGFKFGGWYDTIWMEKFLGEHTDDPAPLAPTKHDML